MSVISYLVIYAYLRLAASSARETNSFFNPTSLPMLGDEEGFHSSPQIYWIAPFLPGRTLTCNLY